MVEFLCSTSISARVLHFAGVMLGVTADMHLIYDEVLLR